MQIFRKYITNFLIYLLRCYHNILSPMMLQSCRFYPSCSEYAIDALKKYGPVKGTGKSIGRVCRCHPFNKGGYDPA